MARVWWGLPADDPDIDSSRISREPSLTVGVIPHTRLRAPLFEMSETTQIESDDPAPRRMANRSRSSPQAIATFTLFGAVLVALILTVGPTSGLTFSPQSSVAPPRDTPATMPAFPTAIQHVIVIMDENKEWSTVWEHGAFEVSLARTYANLSQFYAIRQASWPSYVAATSGDTPPAGPTPINVQNLADLTTAHGETWAQWSESAVGACDRTDNVAHLYDTAHVPFVWYDDVYGNSAECNADVVPMTLTQMQTAFMSGTLPNYTFITPNLYDDGHTYSRTCTPGVTNQPIAETECADAWLQALLTPLISNTALFAHTAVFITYDQTQTSDNSGSIVGASGGHVYASVVSPVVIPGYSSTTPYTDTNLLTTAEWLLGLPGGTLQNDNWTLHPPMEDLFYPAVSGTVSDSVSHAGLPNATVSATVGSVTESRLTAPSGTYELFLPPGMYTVTASDSGYVPGQDSVTVAGAPASGVNFALVAIAFSGPSILSHTFFTVVSSLSGSSSPFDSNPGDAIVVFVAIHSSKTVVSVTDSVGDPFSSNYSERSGSTVGLAVWVAVDATGGPGVVVTMTGSSANDATYAVLVVDVTGVAVSPLTPPPVLVSSAGKDNKALTGSIGAASTELILAGFATRGTVDFSSTGVGSLLDSGTALLNSYDTSGADEYFDAFNAGTVVMSAAINVSEPWAEAIVALEGPA